MDKEIKMRVALNLRRLRTERAVSLSELARESGVSRATLSKVEGGLGNPTIGTLSALAGALGVSVDEVLSNEESRVQVLRRGGGVWLEGSAVDYRLMDRLFGRSVVDVCEHFFADGVRRESLGHGAGTFEHLFVTAGNIVAGPANEPAELGVGDYVRYPADRPHVYEAIGGDARAVLLMSYVRAPSGKQEMQRELEHLLSGGDAPKASQDVPSNERRDPAGEMPT